MKLLRASALNFERLFLLRDSIGHMSKNILSFEFPTSFFFQFKASRYITAICRKSVYKVIIVSIFLEVQVSILSVLIYYPIQSDIIEKSYCRFNFLQASIFNFDHLDILPDSSGHPCIKLLSIQFSKSFESKFWASRYITGLNQTSE